MQGECPNHFKETRVTYQGGKVKAEWFDQETRNEKRGVVARGQLESQLQL